MRRQDAEERLNYQNIMEDLRVKCEEKKEKVDDERKKFMEFKKQVALNSISNRSGKTIPPKVCYIWYLLCLKNWHFFYMMVWQLMYLYMYLGWHRRINTSSAFTALVAWAAFHWQERSRSILVL